MSVHFRQHSSAAPVPPIEPTNFTRRNYWVFVTEGGLFISGIAFVSQDTILPVIVRQLGGGDTILAFLPTLMLIGFALPPLLTAGWIERQGKLYPMLRLFGFFQRLPYLLAALAILIWGRDYPVAALVAAVVCPLLSGLVGGVTMGAWMQITARTVPGRRRSSGAAARNLIGALFGILAGITAEHVLSAYPGAAGFALLHGIAFGLLMASYAVFLLTDEPFAEPPPVHEHRSFLGQLTVFKETLGGDSTFQKYLVSQAGAFLVFATVPFLAVHSLSVTGLEENFTGRLLAFQMGGNIVGNLLGAWLGDRFGSLRSLLAARGAFLVAIVLALTGDTPLAFCLTFSFWGMTHALQMVGQQTFITEHAFGRRLPTYVGLAALVQLVAILGVGALSSTIRSQTDELWPVATLSAIGVIVSAFLLWTRVPDPRIKQSGVE